MSHLLLPNSWDNVMPPGTVIAALEQGSFSDEAARRIAKYVADTRIENVRAIGDVWNAIAAGSAGIIPFENANAGVVWPHLHELSTGQYRIVGEVHHPVNMCAGTHPDVALERTSMVCSHPKAIEQSSKWIDAHRLTQNPNFLSTVDAAKYVAAHPELLAVALGTRSAIEDNGLQLCAEDLADSPAKQNITRMFVVRDNGHSEIPDGMFEHHAAIIRPEEYDGSLVDVLSVIKEAAGLSSIHSRNIGMVEDEDVDAIHDGNTVIQMQYEFFLQMRRRAKLDDPAKRFNNMVLALHGLVGRDRVRWLGSWGRQFAPRENMPRSLASVTKTVSLSPHEKGSA
jgi:prephenate dehydratase